MSFWCNFELSSFALLCVASLLAGCEPISETAEIPQEAVNPTQRGPGRSRLDRLNELALNSREFKQRLTGIQQLLTPGQALPSGVSPVSDGNLLVEIHNRDGSTRSVVTMGPEWLLSELEQGVASTYSRENLLGLYAILVEQLAPQLIPNVQLTSVAATLSTDGLRSLLAATVQRADFQEAVRVRSGSAMPSSAPSADPSAPASLIGHSCSSERHHAAAQKEFWRPRELDLVAVLEFEAVLIEQQTTKKNF